MKGLVEIQINQPRYTCPHFFGPYVFSVDDVFDERTFPQRTQRSVK